MTIKYQDGSTVDGILLSRHQNAMRVAIDGREDATEFVDVMGTWLTEELETVEITFEWQRHSRPVDELTEADFICSKELAARLVRLLETDSEADQKHTVRYMTASRIN